MATVKEEMAVQSVTTVSNGVELAVRLIQQVAGNDVADSLNGNRLNGQMIRSMVLARFRRNLEARQ